MVAQPLYQSGGSGKNPLFKEFFDTSLKILTPAPHVVHVTNMRYDEHQTIPKVIMTLKIQIE